VPKFRKIIKLILNSKRTKLLTTVTTNYKFRTKNKFPQENANTNPVGFQFLPAISLSALKQFAD